jgi:hypothetical protein
MQSQQSQQIDSSRCSNYSTVSQQASAVHNGITCNGCNQSPILGPRYKCAVCPDFDYCERCETTKEHNHPFLKIRRPEQMPINLYMSGAEEFPSFYRDAPPVNTSLMQQSTKTVA